MEVHDKFQMTYVVKYLYFWISSMRFMLASQCLLTTRFRRFLEDTRFEIHSKTSTLTRVPL